MRLAVKLGNRGQITIPNEIRKRIGLVEGSLLVFEVTDEGIYLRPAIPTPLSPEAYANHRKAEFLLNNAVDADDYARARAEVETMGVDPDSVEHERP